MVHNVNIIIFAWIFMIDKLLLKIITHLLFSMRITTAVRFVMHYILIGYNLLISIVLCFISFQ